MSSHQLSSHRISATSLAVALTISSVVTVIDSPPASALSSQMAWSTVANFDNFPPGSPSSTVFNSFSQPSVNDAGLVVFRARTKAAQGGQPVRGIFTRNMSGATQPISSVAEVGDTVPAPNNTGATFNEFPSLPRIDATSNDVITRGQSTPVLSATLADGTTTQTGTSGIYVTTGGSLETGVSLLGNVPGQEIYSVPGEPAGTRFDQFPGAPSVVANTVVFKGNYTVGTSTGLTGVFYRDLSSPANPIELIADSATPIPGESVNFGSTAPPSAATGQVVFTGWDNESSPTKGGIYLANLTPNPTLNTLVHIGEQVPGQATGVVFSNFGEGLSFDGRYVGFWGSWGGFKSSAESPTLTCPTDGNTDLIAWCLTHDNNFVAPVPMHQGIFVYDTATSSLSTVATDDSRFSGFQYWTYSGAPPGVGGADSSMELPHWRVSSFVAISGLSGNNGYQVAFKASTTDGETGVYLGQGPAQARIVAVVRTGDVGSALDNDPNVTAGSIVTSLGLERDGFRNGHLVVNASLLDPVTAAGWGGVYMTTVPNNLALESQVLTFDPVAPAYPGEVQTLTALANSGLPVSYSLDASSAPGVCSINGATVTYLALGTCVVAADSASDLSYTAGHTTLSINVTKRPQTIIFPTVDPAYLSESFALTATSDSHLAVIYTIDPTSQPGVCSLTGSTLSYDQVGHCVVAADQAGDSTYLAAATVRQDILVTLHPQVLTAIGIPSTAYLSTSLLLSVRSDASLPVSYSLDAATTAGTCLLSGGVVTFTSIGSCVINADQAGSATVAAAPTLKVTIAVVALPPVVVPPVVTPLPSAQVITVPPAPSVTLGGTYVLTASANSGLPVVYSVDLASKDICLLSGTTLSFRDVGTCIVNVSQPGDATHAPTSTQLRLHVAAMSSSVALVLTLAKPHYGQTARARARASFAVGTAAGAVQFSLDGRKLGTPVRVNSGSALSPLLLSATRQPLWPGRYRVSAVFTPSDPHRHAVATATAYYVVQRAPSSLRVVATSSSLRAVVSPSNSKTTGTVTFRLSGKVIGRVNLVSGVATLPYRLPPSQLRFLSVNYAGNRFMIGSTTAKADYRP